LHRETMVDDEASLLAAVETAPNDQAPKLIISDWYQEHNAPLMAWAFTWAARNGRMPGRVEDSDYPWEWKRLRAEDELLDAMFSTGRNEPSHISDRVFKQMPRLSGRVVRPSGATIALQFRGLQVAFTSLAMGLDAVSQKVKPAQRSQKSPDT
jgi:uncharacterized protein (TIGR02996 family)